MSKPRTDAAATTLLLPDRYPVLVQLANDPWTTTYLARDPHGQRQVVVRIPAARLMEQPAFCQVLEREALDLLRVHHPRIARVLDAGRTRGVPFVVAEHVEGQSLQDRLSSGQGTQGPAAIYEWMLDVAEALDFIHSKQTLHLDVRPANILFAADGSVRLTDFAFARALRVAGLEAAFPSAATEEATPPETLRGESALPQTDQYALAVTVFRAATGTLPPPEEGGRKEALRQSLSEEATEDVLRALAPVPADRFPSCYEFARAFGLERKRPPRPSGRPATVLVEVPSGPPRRSDLEATSPPSASVEGPRPAPAAREEPPLGHVPTAGVAEGTLPAPRRADLAGLITRQGAGGRSWRVIVGAAGQHATAARAGGFVALPGEELGDLTWLLRTADRAGASRRLIQTCAEAQGVSGLRARMAAGQTLRFVREMDVGDLLLMPAHGDGTLHVGRVSGPYEYEAHPRSAPRCPHRRPVEWVADVPLAEASPRFRRLLEGPPLVLELERDSDLVQSLLKPDDLRRAEREKEAAVIRAVIQSLRGLPPEEFAHVGHSVLSALRFDADLFPGANGDEWQAAGLLHPRGFAEVPLHLWLRRSPDDVDVGSVFEARGALASDEHGAIVTLGEFTSAARAEASQPAKKPIRLIDGTDLALLILEHWERVPEAVRGLLGVRRTERAVIQVSFDVG